MSWSAPVPSCEPMFRRTRLRSAFRRGSYRPVRPEPMAVLAVVTSSPPGADGGHLSIARALVAAAAESGHTAHLVVTPDYGFGRQTASYWAAWKTDVRQI